MYIIGGNFFGGCGIDENSENLITDSTKHTIITQITEITSVTGTQASTTTAPIVEKNIFDAIRRLSIHGKTFPFGCLFGEISDTFTLEKTFYSKEAGYTQYELYHNGKKAAFIGIKGTPTDQNDDKEIAAMIIEDAQLANLTIDGENCVCSVETMMKLFKPDRIHEKDEIGMSGLEYYSDTIDIAILFEDDLADKIIITKKF